MRGLFSDFGIHFEVCGQLLPGLETKIFGAPHISYSRETIGFSDVSRISNCPRPQNSRLQSNHPAARKIQNGCQRKHFPRIDK